MIVPDNNTGIADGMSLVAPAIRLFINLISIFIITRGIYYPSGRQRQYVFSFAVFNIVIFVTCLLLSSAGINLGFAFGLFAVFSIMRYRTVMIPVKEMGYLFVSISIGILNALVLSGDNFLLLAAANVLIIATIYVLDRYAGVEVYKEIVYERIQLITPDNRSELIADLSSRTGLTVYKVDIVSIDFLHDTAVIHAYYKNL